MPIYTKRGDTGTTGLGDGSRSSKASLRIEALGAIDEANSHIGLIAALINPNHPSRGMLIRTQSLLLACGARIAQPQEDWKGSLVLPNQSIITAYERSIDQLTQNLPPLNRFILPGGTPPSAQTHVARTVIRRAERRLIGLKEAGEYVDPQIIRFLNRLSDWLYTLARSYNNEADFQETIWRPDKRPMPLPP